MYPHILKYLKQDYEIEAYQTATDGDVLWGELVQKKSKKRYPIWNGVLILVQDLDDYLSRHIVGVKEHVALDQVKGSFNTFLKEYYSSFNEALNSGEIQMDDESLESERVTTLYWLNHYASANSLIELNPDMAPFMKELVQKYWDCGPLSKVRDFFKAKNLKGSLIEIGCGTGGLAHKLSDNLSAYLGVDTSYQGVFRARQILKTKQNKYKIPTDLINGSLSAMIKGEASERLPLETEFIVADIEADFFKAETWDFTAAFNVIDMLHDPQDLFWVQKKLMKSGGVALQSSPYIWPPEVSKKMDKTDTHSSPEWLLKTAKNLGLNQVLLNETHIPWIFYKNSRQIETYSVHLAAFQK